jgi:hypothetical protein
MPGHLWMAAWVPRQVAGKKTTDRQTGAGAMGLQREFDLNARSEKPVHFEKLDGSNGGMATGLRLRDS